MVYVLPFALQAHAAAGGTSAAFAAHIKSELAKWAKVIKDAGIKGD